MENVTISSALKLITKLIKGDRRGAVVQGFTESNKNRLAEALESFISVDCTMEEG